MEGKENQEEKMDITIIGEEDAASSSSVAGAPAEQVTPKDENQQQMDDVKPKLHAIGAKVQVGTRNTMENIFGRKENSLIWSGNEVVASAISRVRKLEKSNTSDLESNIGLKAAKIPKLESNRGPVAHCSSWRAPEIQTVLEDSSFENHDSIWESRQVDLDDTDSNISSSFSIHGKWSSSPELTLTADTKIIRKKPIPTCAKLFWNSQCVLCELKSPEKDAVTSVPIWKSRSFRLEDIPNVTTGFTSSSSFHNTWSSSSDLILTPDSQLVMPKQLTYTFDKLSISSPCLVSKLNSPDEVSKTSVSVKRLARNLFNQRDLPTLSTDDERIGSEPVDDFSSFSETRAEHVGNSNGSAMSSTMDSFGEQRFVHSTPLRQTLQRRIRELEDELLGSFSNFEDKEEL